MKRTFVAVALLTASAPIAACSSSDDTGPTCTIEGTYIMTGTTASQTDGCNDIPPPAPNAPPTFVTITHGSDAYAIQISGLSGGCLAKETEACKLQTHCDITVTDGTDPTRSTGTYQAVWVFDANGFHGINRLSLPPARSLPSGCELGSNATGARQ